MTIKYVKKWVLCLLCLSVLMISVQTDAAEADGENVVTEPGMQETRVQVTVEKQEEKPAPAPQYHETTNIIKETTETIIKEKILEEKEADAEEKEKTQDTAQETITETLKEKAAEREEEKTKNEEEKRGNTGNTGNTGGYIQQEKENLEKTSKQSFSIWWIFLVLLLLAAAVLLLLGIRKYYREKTGRMK